MKWEDLKPSRVLLDSLISVVVMEQGRPWNFDGDRQLILQSEAG